MVAQGEGWRKGRAARLPQHAPLVRHALRRAGVPEDMRDALLGHSSGGKIGRGYGTGYTMRQLREAVSNVAY